MTLHKFLSLTFTTLSSLSVFCQLSTQTCKLDQYFFPQCFVLSILRVKFSASPFLIMCPDELSRNIHAKKTSGISTKKNKNQKINAGMVKHLNLYFGMLRTFPEVETGSVIQLRYLHFYIPYKIHYNMIQMFKTSFANTQRNDVFVKDLSLSDRVQT